MKRMITTLLLMLFLTGCAAPEAPAQEESFTFVYHGVAISPHGDAASVLEVLGEPKSYTEEASCAFEGLDKTFYYGSIYIATYPMDGKDYVYTIWFADDTVATAEGIHIGSAQGEVETAYGADAFNGTNAFELTKGKSKLTILITDGMVSGVRYEGVLD